MKIHSEQEMLDFGTQFASEILNRKSPSSIVIELIGDVGAGKTTFVRGLAKGLGIKEPITSPSFTISKSYVCPNGRTLTHYDFYRLSDPGLMSEDLMESINKPNSITIIEWADSVSGILPKKRIRIFISYNNDDTRTIRTNM